MTKNSVILQSNWLCSRLLQRTRIIIMEYVARVANHGGWSYFNPHQLRSDKGQITLVL